ASDGAGARRRRHRAHVRRDRARRHAGRRRVLPPRRPAAVRAARAPARVSAEPSLRELLAVAVDAAQAGGRRSLPHFNRTTSVEWKADGTPVTVADSEAESAMRSIIGRAFPTHAILGEEQGETPGTAPYQWIIDPLDGTRTFVRGVPLYGTLVGV